MIGEVVDGSALAAMARADVEATSWILMAYDTSSPLYIPELAFAEVRALRPQAELGAELDVSGVAQRSGVGDQ